MASQNQPTQRPHRTWEETEEVPLPKSLFDKTQTGWRAQAFAATESLDFEKLFEEQRRNGSRPLWRVFEQEISQLRPEFLERVHEYPECREAFDDYQRLRDEEMLKCSERLKESPPVGWFARLKRKFLPRISDEDAARIHTEHDCKIDEALMRVARIAFSTSFTPEPAKDSETGSAEDGQNSDRDSDGARKRTPGAKRVGITHHRLPPLTALALSGGGIRSATLSLGVLQMLARTDAPPTVLENARNLGARPKLRRIELLSTVSGGGYLGAWFMAWLTRLQAEGHPDPLGEVILQLNKKPDTQAVSRLREYSNFLSPRLGAFSADAWTLVSLVSRNLLLNWLLFIPLGLGAIGSIWIVFLFASLIHAWARHSSNEPLRMGFMIAGGVLFMASLVATSLIVKRTQKFIPTASSPGAMPSMRGVSQTVFVFTCALPLVCGAVFFSLAAPAGEIDFASLKKLIMILGVAGAIASPLAARTGGTKLEELLEPYWWAVCGFLTGALLATLLFVAHSLLRLAAAHWPSEAWLFDGLWISVPLCLLCVSTSAAVFIGISSLLRDATDLLHEWWARFGAWILLLSTAWITVVVLTLLIPQFLISTAMDHALAYVGKWLAAGGGVIGILTAALGFFDTSAPTDNEKPSIKTRLRAFFLPIGAGIFACAVIGACSLALLSVAHLGSPRHAFGGSGVISHPELALDGALVLLECVTLIALILLAIVTLAINYSRFTLHALYRERLVRAYLGASNTKRNADRFTGFDPGDNIRLHKMRHVCPFGPYHIMNMTLNLTGTRRLDWQERKGESFTVTSLYAGTQALGYRDVKDYAGPPRFGNALFQHRGLALGTAIAASGAAASPNMGYNSSSLVAFLLTFFNVRLGVWLPNPGPLGKHVYQQSSPTLGLWPAISELLGMSDDTSSFVNITDGGHFDNMGMYELIRRGVRRIVCVDGECDYVTNGSPFKHEGLAQSIRKCAIDFGVRIESDSACWPDGSTEHTKVDIEVKSQKMHFEGNLSKDIPGVEPEWNNNLCPKGFWLARIHYPGDDELDLNGNPKGLKAKDRNGREYVRPEPGYLLYIKPTLFGDLPVDLRNYRAANPDFPQQTTADQWFSESQFESYRKLGEYIANQIPRQYWDCVGL